MLFVVVPSSFLGYGQQICRWFKRWLFVGHFDSKQRGQRTIHLERGRNAVLFFLIREKTLSSPAFECGRIRVFWPRHLSYQIYGYHSLASTMTDIRRSHPCENWMMISHHFPHIQTLFGLHPRLPWEKKRDKFNKTTCTNMENYWGLLQYPWMKIHPAKYNNWLQYFTMNTALTKWLKNGFDKHQTRLEFQYFIPLRKSTNRLNWETSGVSGPTEKLSAFVATLL